MEPPRRVCDMLFRSDMVGPTFGKLAASLTALLLIEALCMELLLPPWAASIEAAMAAYGRSYAVIVGYFVSATAIFWGVGGLMALPALVHVRRWKVQPNKDLDYGKLWRSLPLVVVNFLISVLATPVCFLCLLPESSFDFRALPSPRSLARDIVVWSVVEELLFFHIHRWFHENKAMYARVHKIHHTWTAPISIIAIYCHPLEHALVNVAPLIIGPALCGSHIAAAAVFIGLGLVHTLAVHSGYWFCDDDGMHDEHHAKFNCNYGVLGVLDWWHGTYQLPEAARGASAAPVAAAGSKKGD